MPPVSNVRQISLFPHRDSLQQVEQEALAQLPITNSIELIALLRLQQNTLYSLLGLGPITST